MQTISLVLVIVVVGAGLGDAFTNGTILPGYLCNPGQGLPTSLGGVLLIANLTTPAAASAIANIHHQTSLIAQNNLVQVVNVSTPSTNTPVQSLISGCQYRLAVASAGGEVIDGLVIYATNGQFLYKMGHFTQYGDAMVNWPACGSGHVGAVHKQVVETAVYTGLVWQAPHVYQSSQIVFKGITCTENGYGPWTNDIVYTLEPWSSGYSCPY